MSLTLISLLLLLLCLVQIFLQETSAHRWNLWSIIGNRDTPPQLTVIAARLARAKDNLREALPFFVTLTLIALVKQGDHGPAVPGAAIFLVARIGYVPAYLSGIPGLRSAIWLLANAGLLWMALTLL